MSKCTLLVSKFCLRYSLQVLRFLTERDAPHEEPSMQDQEGDALLPQPSTPHASHRGEIVMVASAPNWLGGAATIGADGQLCIWQLPKHVGISAPAPRIIDVAAATNPESPTDSVRTTLHSVAWSGNGKYIAVCGEQGNMGNGLLRLWCTSASTTTTFDSGSSAADTRSKPTTSFFSRSSITKTTNLSSRVAQFIGRKVGSTARGDAGRSTETSSGSLDDGLQDTSSNNIESGDWWAVPPSVLEGKTVGEHGPFYCVSFDPTGTILASGGVTSASTASKRAVSGQVILWKVGSEDKEWKQVMVLGHGLLPSAVRALAFGPTGRRIATSGGHEGAISFGDNMVRVWDVVQKKVALRISLEAEAGGAVGLDFAPSGRGLAIGCANGDVRIYATDMLDVNEKNGGDSVHGDDAALVRYLSGGSAPPRSQGSLLLQFTRAHVGGTTGVKFGLHGTHIFSIGVDGCVRAWSIATASPVAVFPMRSPLGVAGTLSMGPISILHGRLGVVAGDGSGIPYMLQLDTARQSALDETLTGDDDKR